ncbi:hypothetical protein KM043_003736 [Ampulex compressa]|nr:hypothetical protein KM043_003736 [Ampulex compressa]
MPREAPLIQTACPPGHVLHYVHLSPIWLTSNSLLEADLSFQDVETKGRCPTGAVVLNPLCRHPRKIRGLVFEDVRRANISPHLSRLNKFSSEEERTVTPKKYQ